MCMVHFKALIVNNYLNLILTALSSCWMGLAHPFPFKPLGDPLEEEDRRECLEFCEVYVLEVWITLPIFTG